ncbi:hypothetical protein L1987_03609 [Smallanthus sonchifolius]|uniref:Uncharacterized protein n=1 Tax=Smallanthus sonchifolius TaxID=185202 RepID=A0ACB9KB39_9ASTR|nr:hypothetical protein L1987_03609 [Smallanthus sonchifolius]
MVSKEERRAALYQKIKELGSVSQSEAVNFPCSAKATVEAIDKGFRITVFSEEDCPGLLVAILETFEELGLDVRDANISCSNKFHLQAIGENERHADEIDAQVLKSAVLKAIKNWSHSQQ